MDESRQPSSTGARTPRTTRATAGLALFGAIFGFDDGDADMRADGGERD